MTKDEIIEMARQAGIEVKEPSWGYSESYSFSCFEEAFERFAKLVAQHAQAEEREACAQLCEQGIANADDWNSSYWDQACENRAWAIRARGQA
jgi:hypothetical protein